MHRKHILCNTLSQNRVVQKDGRAVAYVQPYPMTGLNTADNTRADVSARSTDK